MKNDGTSNYCSCLGTFVCYRWMTIAKKARIIMREEESDIGEDH